MSPRELDAQGSRYGARAWFRRWPAASRRPGSGCWPAKAAPADRRFRSLRSRLPDRHAGPARRRRRTHFNPDEWMEPKEQRKVDDFIIYGVAAATQALDGCGLGAETYEEQIETGVLIGSGIGGLGGIAETSLVLDEKGPRRVSPFFMPGRLINLVSGYVSIMHGLKGPNHAVVTACSTGAHAIGDAARLIALGDAEVMVAGGAESAVNRIGIAGFAACKALSTAFNDRPKAASRPYDRDRDGFVMGEGAGCVVLESLEHAKARGAQDLRRSHRLRHVRRRLSHHGARRGRRRRLPLHERGDQARRASPRPTSTTSMRTAPRPMADEIELAAVERAARQRRQRRFPCPRRNRRSAICSARPARSRRFSRPGDPRPHRAADAQPRQSLGRDGDRPRAAQAPRTRKSTSSCRIPSASAAPTLRWSCGNLSDRSCFRHNGGQTA